MAGSLYLVATPIGNLEDITFRAIKTLRDADLVACEDTRHTRKLLDHFEIRKKLVSYHEHNEIERAEELIEMLRAGSDVALVSDAGTPIVSDPGYRIVSLAAREGIPIVPIPGASAALTALAASGLPSDSFVFLGFLPQKSARRRQAIEKIRDLDSTVVLYESPHRVLDTLDELRASLGDRPIVAAREMTKLHEEFLRGTAQSIREALAGRPSVKGEFTIVIGKPDATLKPEATPAEIQQEVAKLVDAGNSRMDAIKAVSRRLKMPKRAVYEIVEER